MEYLFSEIFLVSFEVSTVWLEDRVTESIETYSFIYYSILYISQVVDKYCSDFPPTYELTIRAYGDTSKILMTVSKLNITELAGLEDTKQMLRPDTPYIAVLLAVDGDTTYSLVSKYFTTVKLIPPKIFINSSSYTQQPGRIEVSFPVWTLTEGDEDIVGKLFYCIIICCIFSHYLI